MSQCTLDKYSDQMCDCTNRLLGWVCEKLNIKKSIKAANRAKIEFYFLNLFLERRHRSQAQKDIFLS